MSTFMQSAARVKAMLPKRCSMLMRGCTFTRFPDAMMYLGTCAHAPTSSNKNDRALGCARLVNVVVAKFAESTLIRLHAGLELLVHLIKRTEYGETLLLNYPVESTCLI